MSSAGGSPGVKRRALLGALPLLFTAGCVDSWPTPTGPRGPPEPGSERPDGDQARVDIDEWDIGETDDGRLRVFGTVRNEGEEPAEVTVAVVVRVDEQRYERATTVTVAADESAEFDIEFDLEYDAFAAGGSVDIDLS